MVYNVYRDKPVEINDFVAAFIYSFSFCHKLAVEGLNWMNISFQNKFNKCFEMAQLFKSINNSTICRKLAKRGK